jgi:uncharacterized protein YkwD
MQIESIVKTVADLLLIVLVIVLALQLVSPPQIRSYTPPTVNEGPLIQPSQPIRGMISGHAEQPVLQEPEPINYSVQYFKMEQSIFSKVNNERGSEDLPELIWNDAVAAVAREHSVNLAKENALLTERDLLCYVPFVHHEGFDFGSYHQDRLENHSIYYYSTSGENIFLVSSWVSRKTFDVETEDCNTEMFKQFSGLEQVQSELDQRLEYAEAAPRVNWIFTYVNIEEIEDSIVLGWMDSSGHRGNILDSNYSESGIGIATSNDFYFVTQVFIQKEECGYLTGPCCHEEGYYPYCFVPHYCISNMCME